MRARPFPALLLLTAASLALAAWAGGAGVWSAAVAAAALVGGLLLGPPGGRAGRIGSLILLGTATLAFAAEWDMHRFSADWPEKEEAWEARVQERLAGDLDDLLHQAEEGADWLAGAWVAGEGPRAPGGVRDPGEAGVDALAVFDAEGELVAWDGIHQGPFPEDVRFGRERYAYREGALFGYLYVTRRLEGGEGTVATASLLRADLPPGLDEAATDFTSRFERRRGAVVHISRPDRVEGESAWDLRWNEQVLFSVMVDPRSEAETMQGRSVRWRFVVALGLLAAWLALLPGARGVGWGLAVHVGALVGILLLIPVGELFGAPALFSPTGFLLPFVPAVTLGDLLVLGAAAAFLLGVVPASRFPRAPAWGTAAAAGVLGIPLLSILAGGASRELLGETEWGWTSFQVGATMLVGLLFTVAIVTGRDRRPGVRLAPLVLGLAAAVALALGAAMRVRMGPEVPAAVALLWIPPLYWVTTALPGDRRWSTGALRIVLGVTVAATLTLPWAWSERVQARMAGVEQRVERLGTRPDPFLEFLLLRAGEEAIELAGSGRDGVETLYGAWIRSGLAREDVPVWLTVWGPDGSPGEELRIGVEGERPQVPVDLMRRAVRQREVLLSRHDLADLHYVAAAPLMRGAVVSFVVPPRRAIGVQAPLGPLFSPARGEPDPLVLIPLLEDEPPGPIETIQWVRSREGWQGELHMAYPDEVYHAHYLLELPSPLLLVARGTLLLLLGLTPVLLLWAAGRRVGGDEAERGPGRLVPWLASFRGRVTLTLFGFFLVPSLAFGTLAYRTLSGAATRTAETLAERAVEDAANWYEEVGGSLDLLARRTGSDLLLYEQGELASGSLPELVHLGLYQGWLPPPVHRELAAGEALTASTAATLGGWDYVVAFRRIGSGTVLAAPAPLQAGATALRQREVAGLLGFTVALGAGFSVLLSLLVGRALTSPIQTLRVASERVGAGNMGVHIVEDRSDEFGAVFSAFNRMVDRLGRTRRALVQSSRRTRAIVEEVATGVVALDPAGRVTLANPRAEELLGVPIARNQPLPSGDGEEGPVGILAAWVSAYLRDGEREAGTELQVRERRLRVRARRVSRKEPPAGAVVSIEDVTDELRTERILAWGEMARQVAHEVKNPLTPIKLGVQHVQRAWDDSRPGFEDILRRNVEAVLREIDRLDAIAAGFSRYGAPMPAGSEPPEAVDVGGVVREILALYEAGDGPIRFRARGMTDLPLAEARPSELKEVLVNLFENARAALAAGGDVVVEAEPVDDAVELRVKDDGAGIPPELLPRIFDPHFSTTSGGSGLGLAIVRRLVESWGGKVWIESAPGEGTIVTVRMRAWRSPETKGADATPANS